MKAFLIRAVIVAIICISQVEAGTIRYPQKDPLIRITIPSGWTTMWEKDGSLTCMPQNHSKYVSVIPSENVNSKSGLSAQLTKTAREAASNAKMKDVKLGPIRETTRSNGLSLMSITAEGITKGKTMVFTLVAFAPKTDYFTVIALEPTPSRDKEISGIINSISSAR